MALDTLESYLEPFNFYRIWTAVGVDEAMLELKDKAVNLIITGWKMQPISGLQLVEMVRRREDLKDVPIVLIAEQRNKQMETTGLKAGANSVLSHPINAKKLQDTVTELLAENIDETEEQFMEKMDQARKAERKKDLPVAEEAYKEALGLKEDETALMALGRVLRKLGKSDEAIKSFFAVLRANPDHLKAYLELAMVYRQLSELEDALKVVKAALNAADRIKEGGFTKASLFYYMGEIELQLKHLQNALGHFQDATDEVPDDTGMATQIGDTLAGEGLYAESEEFYEKALEMDPSLAHVYNRLGIAHRKQGKMDMALNLYKKALAFHPKDENLMYNMARCHWEMGEKQMASEVLTKALEVNPGFEEAKVLLSAVLKQLGVQQNENEDAPLPQTEA